MGLARQCLPVQLGGLSHRGYPAPCGWSLVSSPNPSTTSNYIRAVAAVSTDDLWAVGFYNNASSAQTLIEHWDGSAWSVVRSPNVGSDNYLEEVDALAANDVWAVGF